EPSVGDFRAVDEHHEVRCQCNIAAGGARDPIRLLIRCGPPCAGDDPSVRNRADDTRRDFMTMPIMRGYVVAVVVPLVVMFARTLEASTSCGMLSSLSLPETTVTLAEIVPAGDFSVRPAGAATDQKFANLPAFCRVAATLRPSSDSDIK